jgi:hypothetical protein
MRNLILENAMLVLAAIVPVLIGFNTNELFKAVARGGAIAFLGVLIVAFVFDGWLADSGVVQRLIYSNLVVVPQAMLLALVGHIARRLLDYVRRDRRPVSLQRTSRA